MVAGGKGLFFGLVVYGARVGRALVLLFGLFNADFVFFDALEQKLLTAFGRL